MKFTFALLVLAMAITVSHCVFINSKSVLADVQAKTQSASTALKNSVTQLGNTFGKLNDDAIRLIKGVSDKALKAVSDLYASTLGELLKVTDSAIQAEVDGFTSALQSGQDALKSFVSQLSSLRRNILTQSQIDLENTLNDFKKNFNTFIDAQKSFVSDANLVVKKVVGCEATAVNSFNKNVMASVVKDGGACVAAFLKADAAVNAQLGGLFSNISANAVAALKSVTKCVSDNKLTNAASIDAASQTVKDSLTACLDGVTSSTETVIASFKTDVQALIDTTFKGNVDTLRTCVQGVFGNAYSETNTIGPVFLNCITNN